MTPRAVVSIHDVKPSTMEGVLEVAGLLDRLDIRPTTLLVVPGVVWDATSLEQVRDLVFGRGYGVAGHGWGHRGVPPTDLGHRLHAAFFSRDQAEHLSRPREELVRLVGRCHGWFSEVGLPTPELYVPPAWALGSLDPSDVRGLPFTWYEVLGGYITASSGARRVAPLVGFEADTGVREMALRLSNGANIALARVRGPLRIAIHPWDLRLRLSRRLEAVLQRGWRCTTAESVLGGGDRVGAGSAGPGEV